MNRKATSRGFISLLFASAALLFCQTLSQAEIKLDLHDDHLQHQCDWAMYLDVQDIQQYLNYDKSKLHPLSRVRISYRSFPRQMKGGNSQSKSKPYEEIWYYHRTPLGLKRLMEPDLKPETVGIIVLGANDATSDRSAALTNAMLQLLIDLQFRQANTSIVLVPEAAYEQVANNLNYYHFTPELKAREGKQMSIHLCSTSSIKEGYFYLNK